MMSSRLAGTSRSCFSIILFLTVCMSTYSAAPMAAGRRPGGRGGRNGSPVANGGQDQTVAMASTVMLNGSGST